MKTSAEAAFYQFHTVAAKHLQISLNPTHPLSEGLAKSCRLLVIEHGGGAITDFFSVCDVVRGEFDVLRQKEEVPAAALLQNTTRKQKSCA